MALDLGPEAIASGVAGGGVIVAIDKLIAYFQGRDAKEKASRALSEANAEIKRLTGQVQALGSAADLAKHERESLAKDLARAAQDLDKLLSKIERMDESVRTRIDPLIRDITALRALMGRIEK